VDPRRLIRTRRSLAFAAVAISLAAGFVGSAAAAGRSTRSAAGRAPEIVAKTIEGRTFRLSALRGKVVVVDFLTPGCGECQIEAPMLGRAAGTYAQRGVRFVIVDLSNASAGLLRSYYRGQLSVKGVTVVRDHGARVAHSYGVFDLGATFVVSRDGRIAWHGLWHGSNQALSGAISRAL
jgi:thiol-disulfide isomerase/thioredoxin